MRKERGNTLIHCVGGMSRSAAIIIGYLMYKYGYGYEECEKKVKKIRPFIKVNKGFRNQLQIYEKMVNKPKL